MKIDMDVAESSVDEVSFEKELKDLESLGLGLCNRQNLRLLRKTKGDFELVKNFLLAKKALKSKSQQCKREDKLAKKLQKMEKKKEHRDKKEYKERKCWDKKEKKLRKKNEKKETPSSNSNSSQEEAAVAEPDLICLPTKEAWPNGVAHLYLDGNNMLYVLSPIRSLVLKRNNRAAEEALEALAKKFCSALKLEHCTLIFDDTKRVLKEEKFEVCSARPSFVTSDDALVDWAKRNKDRPAVYVTSDRELLHRLKECGNHVFLCKPKEWFFYVAQVLSGSDKKVENLDAWMTEWMKNNLHLEETFAQDLQNKLIIKEGNQ